MTPERSEKIQSVLGQALDLSPEERPQFLYQACASDQSLRTEVESLLSSDKAAGSTFYGHPQPFIWL